MENSGVLKTYGRYESRTKSVFGSRNNAYCFRLFVITVIGSVLIHLFGHYSEGFLANYFYIIVEMALIAHCFSLGVLKIKSKYFVIIVAFLLLQIIASLINIQRGNSDGMDLHKIVLFLAMYFVFYAHAKSIGCTSDRIFDKITVFNIWFAIIAVLFNFIMNSEYILEGNLESIMLSGWHLISFFSSRAYYAFVMIVGFFSALYIMQKSKKHQVIFVLICGVLAANIVMTGARTQIAELICAFFVYTILNRKHKYLWFIMFAICTIVVLSFMWQPLQSFIGRYSLIFTHDSSGSDFSTGRFTMWAAAFQNSDIINWITGHGLGSKDEFLYGNNIIIRGGEIYGSFHSGYVDMFFEAGLIGLIFILSVAIGNIKNIIKYFPKNVRVFFLSLFAAWFIECFTGAGFMFFTWDLMALYASFLFVFLPLFLTSYYKKYAQISSNTIQKEVARR